MTESADRISWGNKLEFILSVVSYAIGLGNVWRFPYYLDRNGGGAFLVPYLIFAIIEGLPLFYLELLLGQSIRQGSIGVWKTISVRLSGVGYAGTITSYMLSIYYNVLIMWILWYFFNSFRFPLPWSDCERLPLAANATISMPVEECQSQGPTGYFFYRETLNITTSLDYPGQPSWQMFICLTVAWVGVYLCMIKGIKTSGKVVYFTALFPYAVMLIFLIRALTLDGISVGLKYLFVPNLEKLLDPTVWFDAATQVFYSFGLGFGGLIAFASYNKVNNNCKRDAICVGAANVGTALFGAVIIFSVLGNKATNFAELCVDNNKVVLSALYPSDSNWIHTDYAGYLQTCNCTVNVAHLSQFYPELDKLKDVVGFDITANETIQQLDNAKLRSAENGTLLSYKTWKLNSSWLVSVDECKPETELKRAGSGTGLAFIAFTAAIQEFPVAPLWSVLFFLMLLSLGLGSEFGTLEGVATNLCDMFPHSKWMKKRWFVGLILCVSGYLIGLLFIFGFAMYFIDIFDTFGVGLPLLLIAVCESCGAIFVCGYKRLSEYSVLVHGSKPELFWKITWHVMPIIMAILCVINIVKRFIDGFFYFAYDPQHGLVDKTSYPTWALVLGLILFLLSFSPIPITAVYYSIKRNKTKTLRNDHSRTTTCDSTLPMLGTQASFSSDDFTNALKTNPADGDGLEFKAANRYTSLNADDSNEC